jgi:hypothetical protein
MRLTRLLTVLVALCLAAGGGYLLRTRDAAGAAPLPERPARWGEEFVGKRVKVKISGQAWGNGSNVRFEFLPEVSGKVVACKEDWLVIEVGGGNSWVARSAIWLVQVEN